MSNVSIRIGLFRFCGWLMIVALFSSWFPGDLFAEANRPAARLVVQPRVLVIAHRGASADYPENTIPAFEAAADAKADLIELDYYHSKDQVPIVFHDQELDRTTDACQQLSREKIAVNTLDWQQLQQLDAGTWFRPEFAGTRIPTLREALSTIRGRSIALIERKGGDAGTCVQLLRRIGCGGACRRTIVRLGLHPILSSAGAPPDGSRAGG